MAVPCGSTTWFCELIGPVKLLKRKHERLEPSKSHRLTIEQFKQKAEYFINIVVEDVEREKIKILFQGDMPRKWRTWLEGVGEIKVEVSHILKDERKGEKLIMGVLHKIDDKMEKYHKEMRDPPEESTNVNDMPTQTSEAETLPVATGAKVQMAPAASEIVHGQMSVPDIIRLQQTLPMRKAGNLFNPAATEPLFSIHETEIVESYPDATLGMLPSHALEIVPVLPEDQEEVQMKSESKSRINKLEMTFGKAEISFPSKKISAIREVEFERPSPIPVAVNSRRSIDHNVQKIIGWMRDDTVRRIGIYGCGGIGKTTVLKALFNHTETKNMFDSIIWVTVSRDSSTRKIRNQVKKQLVLSSPSGSDTSLQPRLVQSLRNKSFLFLLDNVWGWIDLDAAGIPVPTQENGCRFILTTRSLNVCHAMDAERQLEVEAISREESWELFHDQVGGIIYSPSIKLCAENIVAECGGLPLTIVVTGRALRKEDDVSAWKNALRELLLPGSLGKHGSEAVIQQLKFSYDMLKDRDVKDCFLYCASFQEDHEVNIFELINYFIDEGLVAGDMEYSRRRGHHIVRILLKASLLESSGDGSSVQMHDVIRDLASAIMLTGAEGCRFLIRSDLRLTQHLESPDERDEFRTPEDHQLLFGSGAGLTEPPSNDKWEGAMIVFLMDNELVSLPESPSCPNLSILFLQRNKHLRALPESFFDHMPCLEVLDLSQTRIKSLPQSLFKFNRLKALRLRDCKQFSTLPPEVGTLKLLELLNLRGTEIYNLPDEIGNLVHLKDMALSFYGTNNRSEYPKLPQTLVSDGTISRLRHLRELSIAVYPGDQRWSKSIEFITTEMHNLEELEMLEIYFPEVKFLEQFIRESPKWKDEGLTKFRFLVGHNVKRIVDRIPDDVEFDFNKQDRCLIYVNDETLPGAVKEVLNRSTAFYLDHHLNIWNLSEFGLKNFDALKFFILSECPAMKSVIGGKEVEGKAFPLLEHLSIHFLWNLKSICESPVPTGSFSMLRYLSIHTCPELVFVLTSSMVQNLHNLEVLIVEDCEAAQEIIFKDNDIDPGESLLPKLKKLRLRYLPNLVSIWKGSWPPIEHISFYDCPNLRNLHMSFNVVHTIHEIKAEKMWWDELKWEETTLLKQLQDYYTEICDDDL